MKPNIILSSFLVLFVFTVKLQAQPNQSYCQNFNGNQLFISTNASALNLDSTFTIEAWIYLNEPSPFAVIAGKVNDPRENDPYQNYVLVFDQSGLRPEFIQTTGIPGSYTAAISPTDISLNTWTHIAATLGSGSMKLYINGALVATQASPGYPNTTTGVPFSIGAGVTPDFKFTCCGIIGNIKQVRVWNLARTNIDINTTKDINLTGNESNLLACYPMNESSGQILNDISTNKINLSRGISSRTEMEDPSPISEENLSKLFSYTSVLLPQIETNYEDLYVIDYNNDAKLDFLVSSIKWPPTFPATHSQIFGFENSGGLTFTASNPIFGADSTVTPRDHTIGDFNGDGRSDIFIADHGTDIHPFPGELNKLFLQNTSGQIVNTPININSTPDFSHNTASADIDNDGDLDIYVCNIYNQGEVGPYFLINDGTGNFTKTSTNFPDDIANLKTMYMSNSFADIDNDNDMDLILGAIDGGGILEDLILLNNGSGIFTPGAPLPKRYGTAKWGTVDIVAKDFNNDGWVDLLMSTLHEYQTCHLQLLLNNKNGTFSDASANIPQSWETTNTWVKWIEVGDLNNDGFLDIICSSFGGAKPKLYFNHGNALFTDASGVLNPKNLFNILSIRVDDFDNDGTNEIAFLHHDQILIANKIKDYVLSDLTSPIKIENDLVVYPNPFDENFSIKIPDNENFKSLSIYGISGKKIYTTDVFEEVFSLKFLENVVYVFVVETDKQKYSTKIEKK